MSCLSWLTFALVWEQAREFKLHPSTGTSGMTRDMPVMHDTLRHG